MLLTCLRLPVARATQTGVRASRTGLIFSEVPFFRKKKVENHLGRIHGWIRRMSKKIHLNLKYLTIKESNLCQPHKQKLFFKGEAPHDPVLYLVGGAAQALAERGNDAPHDLEGQVAVAVEYVLEVFLP